MKRIGNIYQKICNIDNLKLADKKARKGKHNQYGIQIFDKDRENKLLQLHESLVNKTYKTSKYTTFKIYEPKERIVYRLPYFPDRILHHALMIHLESIFVSVFTSDSYSCIKGKGIHAASYNLRNALKDESNTTYCLKLDVKKFYPNVSHDILKKLLRRKIKDKDLLWLLDEIIDSADGVPIGNYASQYLANFYLTYFDHWLKEVKRIKYYFRYADDIVILSDSKEYLHDILVDIREYFDKELKLIIKQNYQIFPVESRGIDFCGYVHYHEYTRIRKTIKKNFAKKILKTKDRAVISSYNGWLKHADCKHLSKKLLANAN